MKDIYYLIFVKKIQYLNDGLRQENWDTVENREGSDPTLINRH